LRLLFANLLQESSKNNLKLLTMLIAHITDSHIEIPEINDAGRLVDFDRVISHIMQQETKPDLLIHTGDISHCNRPEEYEFAKAAMEKTGLPFEVIPGNKDSRNQLANTFSTPLPFAQKSLEMGGWTLLFLDTVHTGSNLGDYCHARLDWLESELKKTNKPVAIFMHHPSFIMANNPYPFQFIDQAPADQFNDLVSGFDNVKGIFCGHAHRNTTGSVGTIPGMTLTAMSLDRRKGTYAENFDRKPIYQLIKLNEDGGFQTILQAAG